jgi:hypothetical protein
MKTQAIISVMENKNNQNNALYNILEQKTKKRCSLCLSSRTKLTNRLNISGEIIPNEYKCVEYWEKCRER